MGRSSEVTMRARRRAGRMAHQLRAQASTGRARLARNPGTVQVDTQLTPATLVLVPGQRHWCLAHADKVYRLDSRTALELATLLPISAASPVPAAVGDAALVGDRAPVVELRWRGESEQLRLDESAAAVLAPVLMDPQPYHDSWIPTRVDITAESVARLALRLYLPPGDDLPPKRYVVADGGAPIAQGELERGEVSILDIQSAAPPEGRTYSVDLAYADPADEADYRSLGAVLLGITKWIEPELVR